MANHRLGYQPIRTALYLLFPGLVYCHNSYPTTKSMACGLDNEITRIRTIRGSQLHKSYCILATKILCNPEQA